jgi:hypothetical protein
MGWFRLFANCTIRGMLNKKGGFAVKYMAGLKNGDQNLLECICQNKAHIHEVYFSWGDFPNGRSSQLLSDRYAPWELQDMQRQALRRLSDEGIRLNLLFNANCYGADSQSRAFFHKIGTVQGMDYLSEYFDSYYMKRELNRDLQAIDQLHKWAKENGKELFMLANSGCLNHCSAHNFHDNLVAHEAEIAKMDNAYAFGGICHEYLRNPKHHKSLIEDTNFVRPEDMHKYEPYFTAAKLAIRIHPNPSVVLNSYIRGKFSGNILDILEPRHSIYPYVIENGDPLRLIKLEEND